MMILAVNWTNVTIVTLFGIGMVFFILCVLIFVLSLFSVVMTASTSKKTKVKKEVVAQVEETPICESSASESEKAAIAMALHLYFAEVHDTESYCLTIRQNPNSAWNSKIYGMNNLNK